MNEDRVPAPDPGGPTRKPLLEAIDEATVRAPTRGNRKLESFLAGVNEALRNAQELMQSKLGGAVGGLKGLGLPGL